MLKLMFAAVACAMLCLPPSPAAAQTDLDEPGLGGPPPVVDHGRPAPRVKLRTGPRLRTSMTLQRAYTHGFHEGLGWSGILCGPQLVLWGVPFYWVAAEDKTAAPVMLFYLAVPSTILGASAVGVGIWQIATHRQSKLPTARHRSVYNSAFVKGMGLGLLITGVLNMTVSGLLLFYEGGEVWGGDEELGQSMNTALFVAGGVEILAGGIMTLAGHMVADKILSSRLVVAPTALPGGAGLVVGGRF